EQGAVVLETGNALVVLVVEVDVGMTRAMHRVARRFDECLLRCRRREHDLVPTRTQYVGDREQPRDVRDRAAGVRREQDLHPATPGAAPETTPTARRPAARVRAAPVIGPCPQPRPTATAATAP